MRKKKLWLTSSFESGVDHALTVDIDRMMSMTTASSKYKVFISKYFITKFVFLYISLFISRINSFVPKSDHFLIRIIMSKFIFLVKIVLDHTLKILQVL